MKSELRRYVGHQVVVQVGEDSLGGTVESVSRHAVTLYAAALVGGTEPVTVDGRAFIRYEFIRWVQAL